MSYRLLLLQAHTGLHTADPERPNHLRRDSETHQALVPASSLMGALRKQMRDQLYQESQTDGKSAANQDPQIVHLFGQRETEDIAALSASPARLLFLPVRSLRGLHTWVTSPQLLLTLVKDLASTPINTLPDLPQLQNFEALCQAQHPGLLDSQHLVLEEIALRRRGAADSLWQWLELVFAGTTALETLLTRLVIVSDTVMNHFLQTAMVTWVHPEGSRHAHLEMTPPDSIFYSVLHLESDEWHYLGENFPSCLTLGSHRNTGHGLCTSQLLTLQEAN